MASPKKNTNTRKPAVKRSPSKGKTARKPTTRKKVSARKRKKKKVSIKGFLLKWGFIAFIIGVMLLAMFFGLVRIGLFGKIPTNAQLTRIKNPIASEVISADGVLLGRYYIQNRSQADFEEISPNVIKALVATEDSRFYEHKGIDEWALLRVLVKTIILHDRSAGGGSTLSQQVAKNIYGRKNYGLFSMPAAKFREGIIAYHLEKIYSKNEILELYLNTVPFGENTYGIETAAERFFSKSPKNLNIAEAATLIGMLKANTTYNPRLHPSQAMKRRNVVINQMVKAEYLTDEEGKKWKDSPLGVRYKYLVYNTGSAAYFRAKIRSELEKWADRHHKDNGDNYNIYTDGLRVYTTIDSRMQRYAEASIKKHMVWLQQTFDKHWKGREAVNTTTLQKAIQQSERYRKLKEAGKTPAYIAKVFNTPVEMKLFSWQGDKIEKRSPADSVKYVLSILHTGLLGMDPKNGDIKIWVGGIDFEHFQYDHVTSTRQVGSIFKPIVYASALENGAPANQYISNKKEVYKDFQNWSPSNADGMHEGYYSMEGALAHSVNTVSVKVLMQTGINKVIRTARKFGIQSTLPEVPSLALGVANISLLEMVQAYAVFAADGMRVSPRYITRIEDADGHVLLKNDTSNDNEKVLDKEKARIMNHYLQAVVDSGTARSIRSVYHITGDIAAKTGTTQNHADGWFMSYTPDLVIGAWTGAEHPSVHFRTIQYGQGAKMALPEVGMLFSKIQHDTKLTYYTRDSFLPTDLQTQKLLYQPHWLEKAPKTTSKTSLFDIFKPKEDLKPVQIFKPNPDKKAARKRKREARRKARKERDLY